MSGVIAFFTRGRLMVTVATPSVSSTSSSSMERTILGAMGFDPTRKHARSPADYLFVAASVVVTLALVVWALVA